jgi:hypothetical protein
MYGYCFCCFSFEAPRRKQRGMFCRAAEPTGNALAVSVQLSDVFIMPGCRSRKASGHEAVVVYREWSATQRMR